MGTATTEIKVRISTEQKEALTRAAQLSGTNLSQFVREAAQHAADDVLEAAQLDQTTLILADAFDQLLEALDTPAAPNPELVAAAKQLRDLGLD